MDNVERVYRGIRESIADGRFGNGDHLSAETLAGMFGVSRTPVREALRRLHSEGFVNFLPNRGAYVAGWSEEDIEEVFSLRAILEAHAAERAATRLSQDAIVRIEELAEETWSLATSTDRPDLDRIASANAQLHRTIVDAAASRRLATSIASVLEVPLVLRTYQYYTMADLVRSAGHHRELVAAFIRRDPEWAGSVMRNHLRAAYHVVQSARRQPRGATCSGDS